MLARLLLAALAVAAVAVAALALRADDRCDEAKAAVSGAAAGRCGDPRDRAAIAIALLGQGKRAEAVDVVRGITRATPDDYIGWLGLWNLTRDRQALARAHALNPRGTPSPR